MPTKIIATPSRSHNGAHNPYIFIKSRFSSLYKLLLQDYLAGIVDNAHRRLFHRHIKIHEMRHFIAPSSMLEVAPTSIHSSSQKGLHTQHPRLSRSRRDTSSNRPVPSIPLRSDNGRLRRVSPIPLLPGEGPFTERPADAQPGGANSNSRFVGSVL